VWCFGLLRAQFLHCFPGCSCAGAAQRLCRPEFLRLRFYPSSNAAFPSRNFDLSSSVASVCRSRIIKVRRQGPRAKASCECHLSDRVGTLSDHHLAQPGLFPIMSGLCLIVTWLSQTSVRSCRVSVRSSFGSARSLSDRVRSLSDRLLAQPGLCPIVLGLYPIVILLCLLLRVMYRWSDSFCDLLFGLSFVIDL
jgi:hypothetical protein